MVVAPRLAHHKVGHLLRGAGQGRAWVECLGCRARWARLELRPCWQASLARSGFLLVGRLRYQAVRSSRQDLKLPPAAGRGKARLQAPKASEGSAGALLLHPMVAAPVLCCLRGEQACIQSQRRRRNADVDVPG
jgi:hypothetical protein